MMVLLPGLLSTDRFASERSAVTRVMEILGWWWRIIAHLSTQSPRPLPNQAPLTFPSEKTLLQAPTSRLWSSPWFSCHPRPGSLPAIKPMFEKVEESLLHHVCDLRRGEQGVTESPRGEAACPGIAYGAHSLPLSWRSSCGRFGRGDFGARELSSHLITFQRGPHQHHRPHGGHDVIWGNMFRLQNGHEVRQNHGPGACSVPAWSWGQISEVLALPPFCIFLPLQQ